MCVAYALLFDPQTAVGFLDWRFVSRSNATTWTGIAITLGGLPFAVWARFFIGRNWSSAITVKQDHQLVRTGSYAVVRHPIYTGILLAMLGTAIVIDEMRGLIAIALAVVSLDMFLHPRRICAPKAKRTVGSKIIASAACKRKNSLDSGHAGRSEFHCHQPV